MFKNSNNIEFIQDRLLNLESKYQILDIKLNTATTFYNKTIAALEESINRIDKLEKQLNPVSKSKVDDIIFRKGWEYKILGFYKNNYILKAEDGEIYLADINFIDNSDFKRR